MSEYLVIWKIDINADSPEEAAKEALKIQRDSNSWATVFEVKNKNGDSKIIDLEDHSEFCTICECHEIDENSPLIDGIGHVCHDCCNKWFDEHQEK